MGTREEGRVVIVIYMSKELVKMGSSTSEIARNVAKLIGGGGGGKPDMAQAGGTRADKLDEALDYSFKVIKEKVQDTSS